MIKKIFTVVTIMVLGVMSFTGCEGIRGESATASSGINTSFITNASIGFGETESIAFIQRFGKGTWDVVFDTPNSISGVKLSFADDNVTASYKGLNFSVPQSALPVKSAISTFIEVVDEYAEKDEIEGVEKDGNIVIEGTTDQGDYILTLNDKGELFSFEMPNLELVITFTDFRTEGTVPAETTVGGGSETTISETAIAETTIAETTPAS